MMHRIKDNCGATLMELAATISVIGIAVIGLSISYQSILMQYEQDLVRSNLVQYSTLVSQRLAEEANQADEIQFSRRGSFVYVDFKLENDLDPYLEVYGDPDKGVVFDDLVDEDVEAIRFPNFGASFDNNKRKLELKSFEITTDHFEISNVYLRKAIWTIRTEYVLVTDVFQDEREVVEHFVFEREVYLPKRFILNSKNGLQDDGLDA